MAVAAPRLVPTEGTGTDVRFPEFSFLIVSEFAVGESAGKMEPRYRVC